MKSIGTLDPGKSRKIWVNRVWKRQPQAAQFYWVFAKGRIKVDPSKSIIFWTFPDVLVFLPFNMGDFYAGIFGGI